MLALLSVRLIDEFAGFLPTGAFESFRTDLGLTYTQASAVLVAMAPGAMVGNVFSVMADYRSRRVIAAGGAFAFAFALACFGAAPSFPFLLFASFVLGAASTAMCDAAEVALVDISGDETPAQISRSFVFGGIGDILGPLMLIAFASAGMGWRPAFAVAAAVCAVYACWLASLRFPPPPLGDAAHSPAEGLRPIVRDPRVWYFGVLAMLLGPLDEDALAFLIAYLERDIGLSTAGATAIAGASVVGALVGFISTSRHGYRPAARSMRNNAIVIALVTTLAVATRSVALIVFAEFVFGVAVARYWIALKTQLVRLHPDRVGSVHAVVTTIEFSGFALPLFAGVLADAFGVRAGFAFSAVIAFAMLVLVLAGDHRPRRAQARSERAI